MANHAAKNVSVSLPHRPVRAGTASYRSPPPLPRLEIRDDTVQAPDPDADHPAQHLKQQLPAVYQAQNQSTKDFYPTPISVGEMRWPAQSPHEDHRVGHVPTTSQPSSTGSSPDRSMAQLPTGRSYAPPPTMARPHQPAYVHPGHPQPTYGMMRPRLSIHPYAPPAIPQGENRYWSAGGIPPPLGATHERSYSSPSSALSPNSFKAPRKRGERQRDNPVGMALMIADDLQLNVLNEVFDRTSYPSTEEREDLARRLGMTSRSVQIWVRQGSCSLSGLTVSFRTDDVQSRWNSNRRSSEPKQTLWRDRVGFPHRISLNPTSPEVQVGYGRVLRLPVFLHQVLIRQHLMCQCIRTNKRMGGRTQT